jgi:hypothetical protein
MPRFPALVLSISILSVFSSAFSQPGSLPHGQLIDLPCAKALPKGSLAAGLRLSPGGGLLASVAVGLSDRFGIGASYGGDNLIGMGAARMNPRPEVQISYLAAAESDLFPSILVGFDSQGYLRYDQPKKRYAVKSRGVYAVAGKNTSFLGGLGLHAGIGYSLETEDGDRDPDVFAGVHKWIGGEWTLIGEYDTALNDRKGGDPFSGDGLLNAGVRWTFAPGFFFELSWKNILENGGIEHRNAREIKLVYAPSP